MQEATGEVLSYKSLGNYVCAAIDNKAERVNPTVSTLAILAKFLGDSEPTVWRRPAICVADWATWFRYRSKVLAYEEAA